MEKNIYLSGVKVFKLVFNSIMILNLIITVHFTVKIRTIENDTG